MVASAETRSVSDLEKGMGGRVEEAFAAAKERGEAAFVTFVTAGYPAAEGWYRVAPEDDTWSYLLEFALL